MCTQGLNFFRHLIIYLKPILPSLAQKTEHFLNIEPLNWNDSRAALLNHKINLFQPMMMRVEEESLEALLK